MKTAFRRSFTRDLRRITDRSVLRRVQAVIEQVEAADRLEEVPSVRKLSGSSHYYRIRVGVYRIGLAVEGETVEFVRFLHRRDIYRHFP